jgi:hypothetical protein
MDTLALSEANDDSTSPVGSAKLRFLRSPFASAPSCALRRFSLVKRFMSFFESSGAGA